MELDEDDCVCNFEYLPDIDKMIFWKSSYHGMQGFMFENGLHPSITNITGSYKGVYCLRVNKIHQVTSHIDVVKKEVVLVTQTSTPMVFRKKIGEKEFQYVANIDIQKDFNWFGQPFVVNDGNLFYMREGENENEYLVKIMDTESGEKKIIFNNTKEKEKVILLDKIVALFKNNFYFRMKHTVFEYDPRTEVIKILYNNSYDVKYLKAFNGLLYFESFYNGYSYNGEKVSDDYYRFYRATISKDQKVIFNNAGYDEDPFFEVFDAETKTKIIEINFSDRYKSMWLIGEDDKNNFVFGFSKKNPAFFCKEFFSYERESNKTKYLGKVSLPGVADEDIVVNVVIACAGKAAGFVYEQNGARVINYLFVANGEDDVEIIELVCDGFEGCRNSKEIYCSNGFLYYVNYEKNVINAIDLN